MNRDDSYMSFSTMLCYSKHHQDLIEKIDLDYVLTETDSPYLAMTKEERNEPANVVNAVHKIAEIKVKNNVNKTKPSFRFCFSSLCFRCSTLQGFSVWFSYGSRLVSV